MFWQELPNIPFVTGFLFMQTIARSKIGTSWSLSAMNWHNFQSYQKVFAMNWEYLKQWFLIPAGALPCLQEVFAGKWNHPPQKQKGFIHKQDSLIAEILPFLKLVRSWIQFQKVKSERKKFNTRISCFHGLSFQNMCDLSLLMAIKVKSNFKKKILNISI